MIPRARTHGWRLDTLRRIATVRDGSVFRPRGVQVSDTLYKRSPEGFDRGPEIGATIAARLLSSEKVFLHNTNNEEDR